MLHTAHRLEGVAGHPAHIASTQVDKDIESVKTANRPDDLPCGAEDAVNRYEAESLRQQHDHTCSFSSVMGCRPSGLIDGLGEHSGH